MLLLAVLLKSVLFCDLDGPFLSFVKKERSHRAVSRNFPLLVPILILLSNCINSSSLFPVAILCTLLHRETTSFEVKYLHPPVGYSGPPSTINDPSIKSCPEEKTKYMKTFLKLLLLSVSIAARKTMLVKNQVCAPLAQYWNLSCLNEATNYSCNGDILVGSNGGHDLHLQEHPIVDKHLRLDHFPSFDCGIVHLV